MGDIIWLGFAINKAKNEKSPILIRKEEDDKFLVKIKDKQGKWRDWEPFSLLEFAVAVQDLKNKGFEVLMPHKEWVGQPS